MRIRSGAMLVLTLGGLLMVALFALFIKARGFRACVTRASIQTPSFPI
jgi:hypothetical protein